MQLRNYISAYEELNKTKTPISDLSGFFFFFFFFFGFFVVFLMLFFFFDFYVN